MNQIKTLIKENERQFALFTMIVTALVACLMGIMIWKLPVIQVCVMLVLVSGMAVCLQRAAIWLHGITIVALILLGVAFEKTLFLCICATFYAICILTLHFCRK